MKLLPFFLLLSVSIFAQKVSTTQFGDIPIGYSNQQVSQLNPNQLQLLDVSTPEAPEQTITIKGNTYSLVYFKNGRTKELSIFSVSSKSNNLKTLSGIGVGSSVSDLWQKYKNYSISYKKEIDGGKIFTLYDEDNETELQFVVNNQKVSEIRLYNMGLWLNDYAAYSED